MCVVDKNEKTSIYCSENNLSSFLRYYILNSQIPKEIFWSKDYKELFIDNLKISEFNESKGNNRMWMMAENNNNGTNETPEEKILKMNVKKSSFFNGKTEHIPIELMGNNPQFAMYNNVPESNFEIIEDDKDGISFDNSFHNFHNKSLNMNSLNNIKSLNNTYYSADSSAKGLPEINVNGKTDNNVNNINISNNITNVTRGVSTARSVNSSFLDPLEIDPQVRVVKENMINNSLHNIYPQNYIQQLYHQNMKLQKQYLSMKRPNMSFNPGVFPNGEFVPNTKSQFDPNIPYNSGFTLVPNQALFNNNLEFQQGGFFPNQGMNIPFNYTQYYLNNNLIKHEENPADNNKD